MNRNWIIFFIALWVVLVPFLGFPLSWEAFFIVISGLAIAVLAFLGAARERLGDIDFSSQLSNEERTNETK